jgi:hypothetical protein
MRLRLGVFPVWSYVKIRNTPEDILEGLKAVIAMTGKEVGQAQWE